MKIELYPDGPGGGSEEKRLTDVPPDWRTMSRLLRASASVEAATGVALIVVPSLVARMLLGAELSGVGIIVARLAGISLFSLGLACWPTTESTRAASSALLAYNLLVGLYLLYLGIRGEWVGVLLWPAALLHAAIALLLARLARGASYRTR
jgi:hypothetical protein